MMPVCGRKGQTVHNVKRLLTTAGPVAWSLTCIGGEDETDVLFACSAAGAKVRHILDTPRLTYWQALAEETRLTDAPLIATLANDLWACEDWLSAALAEYRAQFGDGDGLLGFAGDGHAPGHSCHFLISRNLLERYGGWPIWYDHNFGDAELCQRAQQDSCYAKAAHAWLEHCHVERGLAVDDAVYQAGRARYRQDEALFMARRAAGWPRVSP